MLMVADSIRRINRTVAVTPGRLRQYNFAEVKRVCQDCTVAGLKAVSESNTGSAKSTIFVYISADGTPYDLTRKPIFLGDYLIMRVGSMNTTRSVNGFETNTGYPEGRD